MKKQFRKASAFAVLLALGGIAAPLLAGCGNKEATTEPVDAKTEAAQQQKNANYAKDMAKQGGPSSR